MNDNIEQSITWKIESIEQNTSDLRKVISGCNPTNVFEIYCGVTPAERTRKEQMEDIVAMIKNDVSRLEKLISKL